MKPSLCALNTLPVRFLKEVYGSVGPSPLDPNSLDNLDQFPNCPFSLRFLKKLLLNNWLLGTLGHSIWDLGQTTAQRLHSLKWWLICWLPLILGESPALGWHLWFSFKVVYSSLWDRFFSVTTGKPGHPLQRWPAGYLRGLSLDFSCSLSACYSWGMSSAGIIWASIPMQMTLSCTSLLTPMIV